MYDAPTLAALERGDLVLRAFLTVFGQTLAGAATSFGYWTGEGNVAANVVPAGGGTPESRNFIGDGTLRDVPPIVEAIGLEARSMTFGLDHIRKSVGLPMDMVFGNDIRVGRFELHEGLLDPATWQLVSNPYLLGAGRVDGAEVEDAPAGSDGSLQLTVVSSVIVLTYTNPAMKSHEQQFLRDGDGFRRYGDTAAQIERWWAQVKATTESSKPTSVFGKTSRGR